MSEGEFIAGGFWRFLEPDAQAKGQGRGILWFVESARKHAAAVLLNAGFTEEALLANGSGRLPGVEPGSLSDVAHMVFSATMTVPLWLHAAKSGGSIDVVTSSVVDLTAKFMILQAMTAGVDGSAAEVARMAMETADRRDNARREQARRDVFESYGAASLEIAKRERQANPKIPRSAIVKIIRARQGEDGLRLPATDDQIDTFLKENGVGRAPWVKGG